MNRSYLFLGLVCLSGFVGCTKTPSHEEAQVKTDFDRICSAQKDFLQASKLPGVNQAELVVERTNRMREGMLSPQALQAVDLLIQPGSVNKKEVVEKAAAEAGLKGWSCAELSQGP